VQDLLRALRNKVWPRFHAHVVVLALTPIVQKHHYQDLLDKVKQNLGLFVRIIVCEVWVLVNVVCADQRHERRQRRNSCARGEG
jgi:hypothetical protein